MQAKSYEFIVVIIHASKLGIVIVCASEISIRYRQLFMWGVYHIILGLYGYLRYSHVVWVTIVSHMLLAWVTISNMFYNDFVKVLVKVIYNIF